MAYCKNCRNKLTNNQTFCTQCGIDNQKDSDEKVRKFNSHKRPFFSKKSWLYIIPILIILISVFGTHLYFSQQYKPEKVVDSLEKAVNNKNAKAIIDIMNEGQSEILLKEEDIDGYIQYLTLENDFQKIIQELKKQSAHIEGNTILHPIKDRYGNDLLLLKKTEKRKWGIYDQYVIEAIPFTLNLSTSFSDTEIKLNGIKGKTLTTTEKYVEIGKLLPGNYTVEGEYKGEYGHLKSEETLDFSKAEENILEHDIDLKGAYVNIESNIENATVFINGEDTKITVLDAKEFGPFATDGSVEIHAEAKSPNGVMKSDTVTVSKNTNIYLNFEEIETANSENLKESVQNNNESPSQKGTESFSYNTYTNDRYGFTVEYPTIFTKGEAPTNGDGRKFYNAESTIFAYAGHINIIEDNETIETYYYRALENAPSPIAFQRLESDWYVISYHDGGNIVYQKGIIGEDIISTLIITYPSSKQAYYDPMVNRVAKSFKGGRTEIGF